MDFKRFDPFSKVTENMVLILAYPNFQNSYKLINFLQNWIYEERMNRILLQTEKIE